MRIDAHSHGMHAEKDEKGNYRPPLMVSWFAKDGPPAEMVRQHRERGIEAVYVVDPPQIAFELQRMFGDFAIPIPQVDSDAVTPAEIDQMFARGARGIKFICPMHSYGDNRYFPLYDVIRSYQGVAVFHTGFLGDALHRPGSVLGRKDVVDMTHMRPAALDRIARAMPDLKMLIAHFGNPWWEETWTVMKSHKHIYADFSGGTAMGKSMTMWKEMFAPNGVLHTQSVSKLVYASDHTHFWAGNFGYTCASEFYDRFYDALQLPAELRQRIDRDNALALLRP